MRHLTCSHDGTMDTTVARSDGRACMRHHTVYPRVSSSVASLNYELSYEPVCFEHGFIALRLAL